MLVVAAIKQAPTHPTHNESRLLAVVFVTGLEAARQEHGVHLMSLDTMHDSARAPCHHRHHRLVSSGQWLTVLMPVQAALNSVKQVAESALKDAGQLHCLNFNALWLLSRTPDAAATRRARTRQTRKESRRPDPDCATGRVQAMSLLDVASGSQATTLASAPAHFPRHKWYKYKTVI
mmetsp:Transcript_135553/g.191808  ORF Transcript_135553/g.191808 Transcript_135553/m.191808 type:complete len:177 (-) Transcript_135553:44-574(-)